MNVQTKAVDEFSILIERDVDVPMRDGTRLKADVFVQKTENGFRRCSISVRTRKTSCGFRPAI